jgi:hypothetical protein
MIPPQRVQGAVHYQPDQLFSHRYAVGDRLARGYPRADIHVAHGKGAGLGKLKGEDVSGTIVTAVLHIEPAHRLTSYKGYGDERFATFAAEHPLNDSADRRR